MTNEELIAKYNPANARNLSQEDLANMRNLTTDQIRVLAEAYPNGARHKAYLVLHDTNVDDAKQMHNLSTWQNLYNVRKYSGLKNLVPASFRDIFTKPQPSAKAPVAARSGNLKNVSARKVVDLSAQEAADELKKNSAAAGKTVTAGRAAEPSTDKGTGTNIAPAAALNDINAQQKTKKASASKKGFKPDNATRSLPVKTEPAEQHVPADQEFTDGGGEAGGENQGGEAGEGGGE